MATQFMSSRLRARQQGSAPMDRWYLNGALIGLYQERYGPGLNGLFIRVVNQSAGVVYLSGAPKDGTFDPGRIPFPSDKEMDGSRKLQFGSGNRLLIHSMTLTTPDGNRFFVESGAPYHQIEVVLHGLLLTLAIYMPFVVSLAVAGGYWLMRGAPPTA